VKVRVAVPGTLEWNCAVALVKKRYQESFDATVNPNPDRFFVCYADSDSNELQALACVGITFASKRRLFSEQYLDAPVEEVIAAREDREIRRDTIIEVGSLATVGFGVAAELIRVLPILAWCMGTEYVITTATARVRNICEKTGIFFLPLGLATPDHLSPAERINWGGYYQEQPITGYISMEELARTFFANNTGRYDLASMVLEVQKAQPRERRKAVPVISTLNVATSDTLIVQELPEIVAIVQSSLND
jgi:Thermostable hemolysin